MEQTNIMLTNSCSFMNVRPIMVDLTYPAIQVKEKNAVYANLLCQDYCGSISEMTAITQYINHENYLSLENCMFAQTIIGIAMAEMIHLQKLTELVILLGGTVNFAVQNKGRQMKWTPDYIRFSNNYKELLMQDIKGEQDAIAQYQMHIKMIKDDNITAVLKRIILDEEYHLMLLKELWNHS